MWQQTHDGWLSQLSGFMVLVDETENNPDTPPPFKHTGIEKMSSLQMKKTTLP